MKPVKHLGMREYWKDKINELETNNNKNKNTRDLYRVINEFNKGYQPRINTIKDENGNLSTDSHSVLNRWKNLTRC
jgi:predicted secreted protein